MILHRFHPFDAFFTAFFYFDLLARVFLLCCCICCRLLLLSCGCRTKGWRAVVGTEEAKKIPKRFLPFAPLPHSCFTIRFFVSSSEHRQLPQPTCPQSLSLSLLRKSILAVLFKGPFFSIAFDEVGDRFCVCECLAFSTLLINSSSSSCSA